MNIDASLSPKELPALAKRDLRGTACVVFDVLRATSTFVTALHNGAEAIVPVSEISEALAVRSKQPDVLLGGERNGVRIYADGIDFDFGNSPREYLPEKVGDKTIVSTTTNGTRALRACVGAKSILAASFLNLSATADLLRREKCENILLVCAGTRENPALEDILAAGALIELLSAREDPRPTLSNSAQIAFEKFAEAKSDLAGTIMREAENAKRLLGIPELRDDVAFCLQHDTHPLTAKMESDGAIRRG
jgi:2-phosphosulfolactate phosphatase